MSPIESNLQHVRAAIERARSAGSAEWTQAVALVAVSKTKSAETVRTAYAAGQRAFGENYAQEGAAKIEALIDIRAGLEWHFIGPLQSNKARLVALNFDWVHTVDRVKTAETLDRHRAGVASPAFSPLNVCVQVNVSGEAGKSGVAPAQALTLARAVAAFPALRLRGLMTIIENTPDEAAQRRQFRMLRELQNQLLNAGLTVDTLSMGMSQDFAVAIDEGATMVRIGSAIFGARN
ncbi:MAG TPA: YggS family pyridoxal phosphate-dependent enzyme [Usitatibacteraceae bacterium]